MGGEGRQRRRRGGRLLRRLLRLLRLLLLVPRALEAAAEAAEAAGQDERGKEACLVAAAAWRVEAGGGSAPGAVRTAARRAHRPCRWRRDRLARSPAGAAGGGARGRVSRARSSRAPTGGCVSRRPRRRSRRTGGCEVTEFAAALGGRGCAPRPSTSSSSARCVEDREEEEGRVRGGAAPSW